MTSVDRGSNSDSGQRVSTEILRFPASLLCILLAALLVRGGALLAARDARLVLDEKEYRLRAEALLDGKGYLGSFQSWVRHGGSPLMAKLPQYPGAFQPPLYPTFIAAVMAVTRRSIFAVQCAQVVLSTFTVALVYWLGRSWFDHRRGLTAAVLCAFYPNLIAFSHYLWSETVFILLLMLTVALLTVPKQLPSRKAFLVAGVLLGLSGLTRSAIVYFVPVLFAWLLFVHRQMWRGVIGRIAVAIAVMVLVISPWTLRNYHVHGGFVLIDTNGAFNLWRGNTPTAFKNRPKPGPQSYRAPFQSLPLMPVSEQWATELVSLTKQKLGEPRPTDLQIVACARQLAWDCIRSDPAAFVRRAGYKIIDMWNPTSFLLRHFRFGAYGAVAPRTESVISWSAVLSYIVVVGFGLIGLLRLLTDPRAWLVVLLVLFFTAIHAVVFGLTRFRLPLMPLIMLLAGHGIWFLRVSMPVVRKRAAAGTPPDGLGLQGSG